MNLAEFIIKIESFNANVNILLIRKAYEFSDKAHNGQFRESGDPFIEHCLEVAFILAEQHLDSTTIAAGLVHDVVEDTNVTLVQVREEFGEEIAELVDGVTKIGELEFKSKEEEQVEYFRKMLLSMAKDLRVILIKLADRLHNMRTLGHLSRDKQIRISEETKEVYAPIAGRLGMAKIKWELEDLSFKYLEAEVYGELVKKINTKREERESFIQEVSKPLEEELSKAGIKAEITGRAKHLYSIFNKMKIRTKPFEEIYDLLAIRVIVDSVKDCYYTLGIIHTMWTPVPERFHDYIATPKANMYQSLHTTVIGPGAQLVEIQIRTPAMHRTAEYGVAAHWLYKEGKKTFEESDRQMAWLREVLEWQKDLTNPAEFLEYLKIELFSEDIFVFTPKGELKQLPRGSTPLDFAFAVHTDIGYKCTGAKINGKLVPLFTSLFSGDRVEITTSAHQTPSQDWLKIVKTPRARSKIRHWLKQKGYEESLSIGKQILEKELHKHSLKLTESEILDLAMGFSFTSSEAMLVSLGNGSFSVGQLISKILPPQPARETPKSIVKKFIDKARGGPRGIKIQGVGGLMYRFAQCCQPIPGEPISGFITRGRGISIHRVDCPNSILLSQDIERRVPVEWDVDKDQSFVVKLDLMVEDRKNLLHDITEALSDTNIRGAEIKTQDTTAYGSLVIEVKNLAHLNRAVKKIKKVKGVIEVERAKGIEIE